MSEKMSKKRFNTVVEELKKFDWQKIIINSNSLSAFNDSQWRFLKGFIIEQCVEKYSDYTLEYVALKHKDYDWKNLNLSVELKSNTSNSMFTGKGRLKKNYSLMLNNSMGTNKKTTLDISDISDIIIGLYSDGVFAIDKITAMKYTVKKGDGFNIIIPKSEVTVIYRQSSSFEEDNLMLSLKDDIINLIRSRIFFIKFRMLILNSSTQQRSKLYRLMLVR